MPEDATQTSLFDTRGAARPTAGKAAGDRRRVLDFLIRRGPEGATDHEIAEALEMLGDTARARRCELRDEGVVVDPGKRRPSPSGHLATVWTIKTAATIDAKPASVGQRVRPIGHTAAAGEVSQTGDIEASTPSDNQVDTAATIDAEPCPRCGSTRYVDCAIHDGQSSRRDCARCGRFIAFTRWHGKPVEARTFRPKCKG